MVDEPTQYEQENDLGRGGGEVDEETQKEAWRNAEERRGTASIGNDDNPGPEPWAKTSSGDTDTP